MRYMKKIVTLCLILTCIFILNPTKVYAMEGYETKNYNVNIRVKENQSYNIEEDIDVNFLEERHGIYRYVPFRGTLERDIDGKTVKTDYKASINDVDINDEYDESTEDDNTIFKIGDADSTITGEHHYSIKYQYQLYNDDEENGFDEFYLNVIPNAWESAIDSSKITIEMPKAFDPSQVKVYSGRYGSRDTEKAVFQVDGNNIIIQASDLDLGEGITVYTKLPENYFIHVPNDFAKIVVCVILGILGTITLFVLWLFYGRNLKYVETVEFYPPEGMSPAQIGYAIDGVVDDKDLISLIIYHAQKGYLSIEETKEKYGRSLIQLHKKIEEIPNKTPYYEKIFFNGLFKGRKSVKLTKLGSSFYKSFLKAMDQLEDSFIDTKTGKNMIFNSSSSAARIGAFFVGLLVYVIGGFINALIAGDVTDVVFCLFGLVSAGFSVYSFYLIEQTSKANTVFSRLMRRFLAVVFTVIMIVVTFIIFYGISNKPIIGIVYCILSIIWAISVGFMGRRTEYGARLLGQILGFRRFLMMAEKERLEKLVEEDPAYFYNILPYAYVLGVSDKWAKNFEQIQLEKPNWYQTDSFTTFTTIGFISHIDQCNKDLHSGIVQSMPSSSSSSSGGGGGGGFSGGGAGGGGGGSW